MSIVERPDGVELSSRISGEGPLVVICDNVFSIPEALDGLEAELATDHEVLRYDPRGVGRSTRAGPYDLETDAADLAAVIESAGDGSVAIGPANGAVVAVRCATLRPDLVRAVVAPVGPPVATPRLEGGLATSGPVLKAIGVQLESDYRGTVRSVTTLGNPQDDEEEHRRRVEAQVAYRPQAAALGRYRAWTHSDTTEESRALGEYLWILLHPGMPWWPAEMADPLREMLPDAHVDVIEDGPVSRPDLTAAVVRRITSAHRS